MKSNPKPELKTARIHQGRFWHDFHPGDILISGNYLGDIVISDGDRFVCEIPAVIPELKTEGRGI